MKIAYIAQTCPPEPGATKRPLEQAKVLAALGHDVTLITAFPSYPLGRVYEGYRHRLWTKETIGGVKVIRVWSLVSANTGIIRRLLSFMTFAFSATIAGLRQGKIDIVIGSVPKPLSELAALVVARIRRATFAIELRDLMPDNLATAGFNTKSFGYRMLDRYYRWIYRKVDVFVLAYKWMIEDLRPRGASKKHMLVLPHAVDPAVISIPREQLRKELSLSDHFIVTYSGSFSSYYKLPFVIDAAEELAKKHPEVTFLLIGMGADFPAIKKRVSRDKLTNVRLLGGIDPPLVAQYLNASDAFIQTQHFEDFTDGTKILEYLSAGKPILNIGIHPRSDGSAEQLEVGLSVTCDNVHELASAISYYATNPAAAKLAGKAALELATTKLERRLVVEKFASELSETITSNA